MVFYTRVAFTGQHRLKKYTFKGFRRSKKREITFNTYACNCRMLLEDIPAVLVRWDVISGMPFFVEKIREM